MPRPPPYVTRRDGDVEPPSDDDAALLPPSKSQRKRESHSLQDLGKQLADLPPAKLKLLNLPEELYTALIDYKRFNKWEALRRQMQYIGRLMRDIDPAPIAAQIDSWSHSTRAGVAVFHEVEKWRDRLLAEPAALEAFCVAHPAADRVKIAALINRAGVERDGGKPPASSRLLFRELGRVMGGV